MILKGPALFARVGTFVDKTQLWPVRIQPRCAAHFGFVRHLKTRAA